MRQDPMQRNLTDRDTTHATTLDTAEMSDTAEKSVPPPIEDDLDRVRTALERAPHVLCCLDFDGTLAPIVANPSEARILPETESVLRTLVEQSAVTVAIVSGRSVEDLRERVEPDAILVGNHGLELERPAVEALDRNDRMFEKDDRVIETGESPDRQTTHPLADAA